MRLGLRKEKRQVNLSPALFSLLETATVIILVVSLLEIMIEI